MATPNCRNKIFGMALASMNVNPASVSDFFDAPELTAVQLPIESILQGDSQLHAKIAARRFALIQTGAVMDPVLTHEIPLAGKKFRDDFAKRTAEILDALHPYGMREAALDFDVSHLLMNPEEEENARRILVSLVPALHRNDMTLLLPYRAPALPNGPDPSLMCRFLRDSLSPRIKLSLEIHPFEFPASFDPRPYVGCLPYELKQTIFCYDADCGNRIQARLLTPWIEALDAFRFDGPFLIAPKSARNRMAIPEFDAFSRVVSDLRNL